MAFKKMEKIENVLVIGALPDTTERKMLYNVISTVCAGYCDNVRSPMDTASSELSDDERYKKALEMVKKADLIFAEFSVPSVGMGIEIREAAILKKNVIVLAKEGSKISGLVKGSGTILRIIEYGDIGHLRHELDSALKELT
jgi:hypothetical protein